MRVLTALFLIGIFSSALAGVEGKRAYVSTGADGASWTIGNDLVECQLRFDHRVGLYTSSWRSKLTGTDFLRRAQAEGRRGAEFSFQVDGERLAGANRGGSVFALIGAEARDLAPEGKCLKVTLRAKTLPLDVVVFAAVHDGYPVIRRWLAITNRGAAPVTLSHLTIAELPLQAGPPADLQVSGFYAVQPREIFFTGRVDDAAILERNSRTGEGFVVMNEVPGALKRTEMEGWGRGLAVMYDTDLFPFERRLAPGETFTTARSSVALVAEARGMADPRWVVPSYASQVLRRPAAAGPPPWIYNTWEPFLRGINEPTTLELVSAAARMGLDVFTVDDGWQADYGSNAINTQAFPHGLEPIQRAVERAGMRLGLWVPLAAISTNTDVYRQHPEWACQDARGRAKSTSTASGQQVVMCLATPYRQVAAERINELIGRYNLKYVKIDLTTVFNAYGEAPGCYARGHDHQTWAESLARIYEGIQYVTGQIYRQHPDVLLDLTFELWGQKHLIDYGLLAAGDLDWLSNVDDATPDAAGPRQARTLLYQRALAMPTEAMLIGNLHANTRPLEERLATAMGAGPLFLGDLRQLTPAELDWYAAKIRWFKALRARVPIDEGFFPLGAWPQPGALAWDGFARLSRQGEGLIAIFRNDSGVAQVEIKIPVFPDGDFTVRSEMTGKSLGRLTGEQFRRGVPIPLPSEYKVELLELRR
jgi:alpha-galactosidase